MNKQKNKALITGITGQDGSYLAELLLGKGYDVVGLIRRTSHHATERIDHLLSDIQLVEGDLNDYVSLQSVINKYKPDEIYNLAAQSHVRTSFDQPLYTFDVVAKGVLNLLEIIRTTSSPIKFLQASSSEMFGDQFTVDQLIVDQSIIEGGMKYQDENTRMNPQSPYAIAKLAAYNFTKLYRQSYNLFICNTIAFNHESPRRGDEFVTKKVVKWIGDFMEWKYKVMDPVTLSFTHQTHIFTTDGKHSFPKLTLGNLDASRDWSHAKDMVRAMYLALQQNQPDDYVVASGTTHTVEEFVTTAFKMVGIDDWMLYAITDPSLFRPSEVPYLCGKADKARAKLWWEPQISFQELIQDMLYEELKNRKGCGLSEVCK